jgi:hypothetical protein
VTSLSGGPAPGQFFPQGKPVILIQNDGVQKEVGLTDEQAKKITVLADKIRDTVRTELDKQKVGPTERHGDEQKMAVLQKALGEATKEVERILTPPQMKRLRQLCLQQSGNQAFTEPDVAKTLKLSKEQIDQIEKINNAANKKLRDIFAAAQGGELEDMRTKGTALRKATLDQVMSMLSAEQQQSWEELVGKPFELNMQRPGENRPKADSKPGTKVGEERPPAEAPELAVPRVKGSLSFAEVDKRIKEWQPTKQERNYDRIAWVTTLGEAERLAKDNNRPVFLFTYDGRPECCRT